MPKASLSLNSNSPEETAAIASRLALVSGIGDVIVLTGDLGAGKTHFAKGFAAGLEVDALIVSPTFTLANRYEGRLELNHLDVYRLQSDGQTEDLGLDEMFETGVTLIEWGERISSVLPKDLLTVTLTYDQSEQLSSEETDEALGVTEVLDCYREISFESSSSSWSGRLDKVKP